MTEEKDNLTDHEYDGIGELNNAMPRWWLYLFYFTILWGILYLVHYHVLKTGDLSYAEYQRELNPNWQPEERSGLFKSYHSPFYAETDMTPRTLEGIDLPAAAGIAVQGEQSEIIFNDLIKQAMQHASAGNLEKLKSAFPDLWQELASGNTGSGETAQLVLAETTPAAAYQPLTDAAALTAGKNIFSTNCATCHGQAGEGGIGPNMTDDYWLHGGGINNIINTIENGVPVKGMIAWRGVLKSEQILQIASYLLTLKGTNPPNAKAPQGDLYKPM
jgi:mono/diheme cytochrome c family protein